MWFVHDESTVLDRVLIEIGFPTFVSQMLPLIEEPLIKYSLI